MIAVAAMTLTACGSTDDKPSADGVSSSAPATTKTSTPPTDPTTAAIDKLTDGKAVELTTDTLPEPPDGFNAAEVAAFGNRAIDLIERGISPEVATMNEDEAFNYVFANQYTASTDATRKAFEAVDPDLSYAWVVASRFNETPVEPAKVLAARWQVTTSEGQTADGTTAPILQVVLSVAVEHQVPNQSADAGGTVPIVMQRTVLVSGFRPLGGEQWWPSIGYQANPYFGGKCALVNGGILTPATRPATIKEDLNDLRNYINKPKTINGATSAGSDLDGYVAKYCEDA